MEKWADKEGWGGDLDLKMNSTMQFKEGNNWKACFDEDRGLSKTLGIPVMISFMNQTQVVSLTLPATKEVVDSADYETFNKEIAPYVDSLEIMMFQ